MTATIKSKPGDIVDIVCFNHYGFTAGAVERVLDANVGLSAHGPILPGGIVIRLPDINLAQQGLVDLF